MATPKKNGTPAIATAPAAATPAAPPQAVAATPKAQGLQTIPKDLLDNAGKGTENVTADDVRPPRLALAQAGSPQVKRGDAKSIEGLREGDFFNDLSGEIYGIGPIDVVVIRYIGSRWMLLAPFNEGGGVLEWDVPKNDPRNNFTTDPVTKKRVKPLTTKFMDFLIWIPSLQEMMSLSMKGTQLKKAVQLISLMKLPLKIEGSLLANPPAWSRVFSIGSAIEKKDPYSWANFTVKQNGITPQDVREAAAQLFRSFADKKIVIDDVDDVPNEGSQTEMHPDDPNAEKEM